MITASWPRLTDFSILLMNNNRSKAYLQNLIRARHRPSRAVVLDSGGERLPEHTESDQKIHRQTQQTLTRDCPEAGLSFDEKEGIEKRFTRFDRKENETHPEWHIELSDQPSLHQLLSEHGLSILIAPHHGLESGYSEDLLKSIKGKKPP